MIYLSGMVGVIKAIVMFFWLLFLGLLTLAIFKPKKMRHKLLWSALVLSVFILPLVLIRIEGEHERKIWLRQVESAKAFLNTRCQNPRVGKHIKRTVENVAGLRLINVRLPAGAARESDQNMVDPYGGMHDDGGLKYIIPFLTTRSSAGPEAYYTFVDAPSLLDGTLHRYSIVASDHSVPPHGTVFEKNGKPFNYDNPEKREVVLQVPAPDASPRYGVEFEDLTTSEERSKWVAGGAIRVIDQSTGEVIAELVGYMMGQGFGSNRSSWVVRNTDWTCPSLPRGTVFFVHEVLKPGERNKMDKP